MFSKTISRGLAEEGVKHYMLAHKIYLTEENKRERIRFAEHYKDK